MSAHFHSGNNVHEHVYLLKEASRDFYWYKSIEASMYYIYIMYMYFNGLVVCAPFFFISFLLPFSSSLCTCTCTCVHVKIQHSDQPQ